MGMNVLRAQDIVDLFGTGEPFRPASTALALLARLERDASPAGLRRLSVGERDRRLLALRAAAFGPRVEVVSSCPVCALAVEFAFTADEVGLAADAPTPASEAEWPIGGRRLRLRAVTAGDLADLESCGEPAEIRRRLIEACVLAVDGIEGAAPPAEWSDAVEAGLQAIDPAANVELALDCPDCGHRWIEVVDPPSLLWDAIMVAAPRILADVAELARVYHWSERDILAMPARRRRFYLEVARS
jgi:hypothetical protein